MYIFTFMYITVHIHTYMYIYVYMYLCIYILAELFSLAKDSPEVCLTSASALNEKLLSGNENTTHTNNWLCSTSCKVVCLTSASACGKRLPDWKHQPVRTTDYVRHHVKLSASDKNANDKQLLYQVIPICLWLTSRNTLKYAYDYNNMPMIMPIYQ